MKSLDIFIFLCIFVNVSCIVQKNCTLRDPNQKKIDLIKGVELLYGDKFVTTDSKYTYALSFCSEVATKTPANVSVVRKELNSNHTTILGRYNDTDIIGGDNWRIITYASGEKINTTGPCKGTDWKTLVMVTCHTKSDDIDHLELLDPMNLGCFAIFHVKTTVLCPIPPQSGFTIFLIILLTVIICYLVIGMAYRRFVTGAKGLEQIPNYDFWRNPCHYVEELATRSDNRRSEPWRTDSRHDLADEPLLHP